jgi:hypothetical protein
MQKVFLLIVFLFNMGTIANSQMVALANAEGKRFDKKKNMIVYDKYNLSEDLNGNLYSGKTKIYEPRDSAHKYFVFDKVYLIIALQSSKIDYSPSPKFFVFDEIIVMPLLKKKCLYTCKLGNVLGNEIINIDVDKKQIIVKRTNEKEGKKLPITLLN